MASILNSILISSDFSNAIADSVALKAKESLYGLKDIEDKDWLEIFYYFSFYNTLYLNNLMLAGGVYSYFTDQEYLSIQEELIQAYIP